MDITKKLLDLDPTLQQHNEGSWELPYMSSTGFSSFNDAGVEIEVGEFLYAMVRVLKPDNVLETGTHWGIAASYMATALKDNNKGKLITIEFAEDNYNKAYERFKKLELTNQITNLRADVREFTPSCNFKLILLDTEPQLRFDEFVRFWDYLEPGGFLFIHDLHQHMHQINNEEHGFAWPFGELPAFMKTLVRSGQARPFHFETPRGLTGFYKVHPEDYKWS